MRASAHLFCLALLVGGVSIGCQSAQSSDEWNRRLTSEELFEVVISSREEPIPINVMHEWTIKIAKDGTPVDGAEVTIDGGMPEHQHGLPTVPQVTSNTGNGEYLVEGMKFNMTGRWELHVMVTHGGEVDDATFEFTLR